MTRYHHHRSLLSGRRASLEREKYIKAWADNTRKAAAAIHFGAPQASLPDVKKRTLTNAELEIFSKARAAGEGLRRTFDSWVDIGRAVQVARRHPAEAPRDRHHSASDRCANHGGAP
jgi:hypothetical protein